MPRDYTDQPRAGNGKFIKDLSNLERDAEAMRLRARCRTWSSIADTLGYSNAGHAQQAVKKHAESIIRPAAEDYRREMDNQLDEMQHAAIEVLERRHYTISNGAPVYIGTTEDEPPLEDDGPVLQAIATILKVQERRAKLWGLDAPTKVQAEVSNVRITIEGAEDV